MPGIGIISAVPGACTVGSSSGTSMACPAVTGCAALVRQFFEEGYYPSGTENAADAFTPTAALVKATLLNSGQDMTGVSGYPSNREGWGRILLDDALQFAGDARLDWVADVRNANGLSTGEEQEYRLQIGNDQTLRATMVFTDQPAAVSASLAPINDLDAELEGPDGLFLGNVFSGGISSAGGAADNLNNVERFVLPPGGFTAGEWILRVRGTSIPDGPQGFAIHVSGNVSEIVSTGVEPIRTLSNPVTMLAQSRPNPFAQSTLIRFGLARHQDVILAVYDIGGRRVRTLAQGSFEPGEYQVTWDARDERGEKVSAGIYFARLQGHEADLTRKMVLLQWVLAAASVSGECKTASGDAAA